MASDITKSMNARITDLADKYRSLTEQIQLFENYKAIVKTELIQLLEAEGSKQVGDIELVERVNTKEVAIKTIKELFKDEESDMINHLMVKVDIESSVYHLQMFMGLQDVIARKIGRRLEELQETRVKDLRLP